MRRVLPLLLAAILALPSIAAASSGTPVHSTKTTKWALLGFGKHRNKTPKAPRARKAPKAKRSKRAR